MLKISFPRMGLYTRIFEYLLSELGCNVILARPTHREALKKGVAHSPEMQCVPFKFNLSNYIEVLEEHNGDITLIHFKTCGRCRFHTYYLAQERILRDLGYEFDGIYALSAKNFIPMLSKITGKSKIAVMLAIYKAYRMLIELERKQSKLNSGGDIKVGIFGEIFTCVEEMCNLNLIKKLKSLGCHVENSMTLENFIKHNLRLRFRRSYRSQWRKAKKLFPEKLGGHGIHSIMHLINFAERGYDGVIFVRPLTCMPETAVEPIINSLANNYKIPILILNFDEFTSETNLQNRLEAFVEMIRLKANGNYWNRCR